MVVLTKGQKRALESTDEPVLKKTKLADWDPESKEIFKKDHKGSCWNFAETEECKFGEECRFNHVTRDGDLVQEAKLKTKTEKKKSKKKKSKKKSKKKTQNEVTRKTKEECIAEREIDEEDNLYTGTVKFFKKGYGFISIEEDITFKNLTASKKIYVMKEDIISEFDDIGLKKDDKVIFKVYKDSMGLGAMDVLYDDAPVVFEGASETKEVVEKEQTPEPKEQTPQPKEQTPEPIKTKKTLTKKKSPKSVTKKKAVKKTKKKVVKKKVVKKTTKRKSKRSKKN